MPKDTNPDQPLTKEGVEHATSVANHLKWSHTGIMRIFHSEKTRAVQTAEIFAKALGKPFRG